VKELEGTVALVTGASSGIGEATAELLAGAGAAVAVVARRRDRLESLAKRLGADGSRVELIEADLSEPEAGEKVVQRTVQTLGRLDIVVNNAGVMLLGPVVGADLENWQRMVQLNLLALMAVSRAALPHLLEAANGEPRGVADLVNVSSVAGRLARSGSAGYNATKWGVNAFSEALRQEVTRRHVRVGLVEPGAVDTELAGHNKPEVQEQMRQRFGEVEILKAEDIARAVLYMVTQPRRAAVNEILVRPTEQEG
jgi:NADP-dependent 3-hydroxy acid dehydrogenase YdfG